MMTWHVAHADRGQYKENICCLLFSIIIRHNGMKTWHVALSTEVSTRNKKD